MRCHLLVCEGTVGLKSISEHCCLMRKERISHILVHKVAHVSTSAARRVLVANFWGLVLTPVINFLSVVACKPR
jgi:hypothetical protein